MLVARGVAGVPVRVPLGVARVPVAAGEALRFGEAVGVPAVAVIVPTAGDIVPVPAAVTVTAGVPGHDRLDEL